jgi:RimJ/RimL family protein N-acetyltransferase
VRLPPADDDRSVSAWHIFHVLADEQDALPVRLRDCGINTGVHYKPIHLYRCYGQLASLPGAESLFRRLFSLPMYPDLSDDDVDHVIDSVRGFHGSPGRAVAPSREPPGVQLRPVGEEDLELLRAWRNDPGIRPWFFDDREITAASQRAWFERYRQDDRDQLFVIEAPAGTPVGTVGLAGVDPQHGTAELGRCLIGPPEARARGYMTAGVPALCDRAIAVYERCGFRREGLLRGARVVGGVPRDIVVMARLRPPANHDGPAWPSSTASG